MKDKPEDWMNAKWRPLMAYMYMVVCVFDFTIAPIFWTLAQAVYRGHVNEQWQPITLQGAGLFHLAMGAILGVTAYGRTQEKLNGANNGGANLLSSGNSAFGIPSTNPQTQSNATTNIAVSPISNKPRPVPTSDPVL